jgi:RNA polymerase sigma-70 factor (ECF subfamily)
VTEESSSRLRRLVGTYFEPLWRFMRRLGVLEMDLDDAMQEVVIVTSERLKDIPVTSERSFLYGTAFRIASEWRRKRSGRREVGEEMLIDHIDPRPEPDAVSQDADARALLDRVLAQMPTDMRAVFTLYELEEMTMAEIADVLSLAPGTVASRLRRARAHFEAQIADLQRDMGGDLFEGDPKEARRPASLHTNTSERRA